MYELLHCVLKDLPFPKYIQYLLKPRLNSTNITLNFEELLTKCKWMNSMFTKKICAVMHEERMTKTIYSKEMIHVPNVENICKLFCNSRQITFLMLNYPNLLGLPLGDLFQELPYISNETNIKCVNFQWSSEIPICDGLYECQQKLNSIKWSVSLSKRVITFAHTESTGIEMNSKHVSEIPDVTSEIKKNIRQRLISTTTNSTKWMKNSSSWMIMETCSLQLQTRNPTKRTENLAKSICMSYNPQYSSAAQSPRNMSDSNPPVLKLPPTLIHKRSSTLIPTLVKQPTRDMELLYHKYSLVRVPSVSNFFEQETLTEYQSLKDHEFIKHFIIHPQNHFNESQLDKLYNDSSPSNTNIFHDDSGNFKQIQQQRDEIEICKLFEEYKQHENTHSPTGRKSLKCCDKDKCNWLLMKPKPLLSKLTIMSQILHVYFYHSSMYEQQKNSATNFQQRFCQYNAVEKTQLRQLENVGEMHMHKQKQIDIPQAESEPENKCELGNKCKELQFLLKYGDYKKYQSVVIEQLTDECIYAYLDHCIDCHLKLRYDEYKCYHGDDCKVYNEFSPGDNKIDTLQALIHTYFYHNTMLNELQNEEQKVKSCIKTKTKTYDDEYKIHYKKTLQTVLSSKTSPENLVRFGEPWVVEKQDAKFKNPKKEILHNVYCSLQNKDWNDILKMSVQLIKRPRA
eukprot:269038_1